ncbi:carbohydrate kinase [Phaeobacter sp. 22II1-1F12B]|uniref:carbohydrate kinase family protein n=1 Tax=Phaeobacter sp. 22II1-1F12B TaxID=1317111 RepID=UPI000B524CF6|nr:carbohydrate kinase [Phaeobacter sp. 22II1-1F12B]OWU73809.1 carbohydrate kinase [Phaeobacter sp. 22II1-1F12B]
MILCCGEALIDMIPEQLGDGRTGFVPHAGGAIFNTAIALGRLGTNAGMVTGLSTDLFGQQLLTELQASKVDTSTVVRTERNTTLAFVHLSDGQATYDFFDENSAGRMLRAEDLPEIPADVAAMYFGGISLACEPCADTYADLLLRKAPDCAIVLDPNIRPAFIQDQARYRVRMAKIIAHCEIVKVSDDDLEWMTGATGAKLRDQADQMLAQGVSLVVVTQGAKGAIAYHAEGFEVSVPATQVRAVDTVGAGDTFNAGLMAHLSDGGDLSKEGIRALTPDKVRAALQFGAKVAAVTVSRAGANPPWASELSDT